MALIRSYGALIRATIEKVGISLEDVMPPQECPKQQQAAQEQQADIAQAQAEVTQATRQKAKTEYQMTNDALNVV